jgi:hypothetical protein
MATLGVGIRMRRASATDHKSALEHAVRACALIGERRTQAVYSTPHRMKDRYPLRPKGNARISAANDSSPAFPRVGANDYFVPQADTLVFRGRRNTEVHLIPDIGHCAVLGGVSKLSYAVAPEADRFGCPLARRQQRKRRTGAKTSKLHTN